MDLLQIPDASCLQQAIRGAMRRIPRQRPIDRETVLRLFYGFHDAIGLSEIGREGFLHQHVHAIRCDLLHPFSVSTTRGTKHDHIGPSLLNAFFPVGEHPVLRHLTGRDYILHLLGVVMTDSHQFRVPLAVHTAEQLIHMTEIKIDTGDAPFFS